MTYSVLLLGATGSVGVKVSRELELNKNQLKRVTFLTPVSDAGPEKEARYKAIKLDRVVGRYDDASSYRGFDIVISVVGDDLCAQQVSYMDEAFAAGPLNGADLTKDENRDEGYFVHKVAARKHVEKWAESDPSLGYTYIMTGIFSDFMLEFNTIFLSEDKKSGDFTGSPESTLSTTHSDDVGKLVVNSLLPTHLTSLSARREIRFAGTILKTPELFSTVAEVLGHPVEVKYGTKEESYIYEKEQKALGNEFLSKFTSARRSIGFGGAELVSVDNDDYPEIKPKPWVEMVKEFLTKQYGYGQVIMNILIPDCDHRNVTVLSC